jgi:hypothetical protein
MVRFSQFLIAFVQARASSLLVHGRGLKRDPSAGAIRILFVTRGAARMKERAMSRDAADVDPLRTAGDALGLAVQAVREGAADAQAKVAELMPSAGEFLGRITYTSCYMMSYGLVFPALLMARAVPKDNAIVHGLLDGAAAARDALGSSRH